METSAKQKSTRPRRRRASSSHLRPVAGMMDRLSSMTLDELEREKQRLERERNLRGIGPDDWYRLHAIRALLTRHEIEHLQSTAWATKPQQQSPPSGRS